MATVECMLLSEVTDKSVLDDNTKSYQVKENGVRALVHVKDGKIVGLRGRSGGPLTYMFPELRGAKLNCDTAILDCEIVSYQDVYIDKETKRELTKEELKNYDKIEVVNDKM